MDEVRVGSTDVQEEAACTGLKLRRCDLVKTVGLGFVTQGASIG